MGCAASGAVIHAIDLAFEHFARFGVTTRSSACSSPASGEQCEHHGVCANDWGVRDSTLPRQVRRRRRSSLLLCGCGLRA